MSTRPLPTFKHDAIGKSTSPRGKAYDHANYIAGEDRCTKIIGHNMPADRDGMRPFFDAQAYRDGQPVNGRVCDKLMIALPVELTKEQRHEAVSSFMMELGQGRIAWVAAFHDKGKDEKNPHAHIMFRDEDVERGSKVVGTTTSMRDVREATERGWKVPPRTTTLDLRQGWCAHINKEMERHGLEARFDARTLKAQGINREPQIHIGPKAAAMEKAGKTFESKDRERAGGARVALYTEIDAGSRMQFNERIKERNARRDTITTERGSASEVTGQEQKRRDADLQTYLRASLNRGADPKENTERKQVRNDHSARRSEQRTEQTLDREALKQMQKSESDSHKHFAKALYAQARSEAHAEVGAMFADKWGAVHRIEDAKERAAAAAALKGEQAAAYKAASDAAVQEARAIKDREWQAMRARQAQDRKDLADDHKEERSTLSRELAAENLATTAKWSAVHLQRDHAAMVRAFSGSQSMPTVQTKQIELMKYRAKAQAARPVQPKPMHPTEHSLRQVIQWQTEEATRHYQESARARATGTTLREKLNAGREVTDVGAMRAQREQERSLANRDGTENREAKQTEQGQNAARSGGRER